MVKTKWWNANLESNNVAGKEGTYLEMGRSGFTSSMDLHSGSSFAGSILF